jgi:hypothetical protein
VVLIVAVILTVGTNTATKLKGPIGSLAAGVPAAGERRVNREAEERRKARQQLLAARRRGPRVRRSGDHQPERAQLEEAWTSATPWRG